MSSLHRDVSALDERLRRLEDLIADLRAPATPRPDLVVIPSTAPRTLGA